MSVWQMETSDDPLVWRKTVMHINQREDRGRHQWDLIRNIVDYSKIETPVANPL